MNHSKTLSLRLELTMAAIACIAVLCVTISATYAWYVYHTEKSVREVHLAAGSGSNLLISNQSDGSYGKFTDMENFSGRLTPVSTNRILGGFQLVRGFTVGSQGLQLASIFDKSTPSCYYRTSLFVRTDGSAVQVYLRGISYEDENLQYPLSAGIRVGLVSRELDYRKDGETVILSVPAEAIADGQQKYEYIIEINSQKDLPFRQYNTATGAEGYVLDCTKTDGTTLPFTPKTSENYCKIDPETGAWYADTDTIVLGSTQWDGNGGTLVQVDVYIWLEGCDPDCVQELVAQTMTSISMTFLGLSATQ